jgi:hypothetical protein
MSVDYFKKGYQLGMTGERLDYPVGLTAREQMEYHEGWVEGISHKLCQLIAEKQSKDRNLPKGIDNTLR